MKRINADTSSYELIASKCAVQEGASESDLNALLAFEMPTTKLGKCMNACIGEKTGIVSKATEMNNFTGTF